MAFPYQISSIQHHPGPSSLPFGLFEVVSQLPVFPLQTLQPGIGDSGTIPWDSPGFEKALPKNRWIMLDLS
jgi:hypothetical protein